MKLTQKKAKRELEIMNMIGDSAFKLVAYVTFYLIHEFVWTLGSTFVGFLVLVWLVPSERGPTAFLVFIALFVPTFLIRLVNLGKFTAKLFDPEKAKKILEDIVAGRPVSAGGPSLPNHE